MPARQATGGEEQVGRLRRFFRGVGQGALEVGRGAWNDLRDPVGAIRRELTPTGMVPGLDETQQFAAGFQRGWGTGGAAGGGNRSTGSVVRQGFVGDSSGTQQGSSGGMPAPARLRPADDSIMRGGMEGDTMPAPARLSVPRGDRISGDGMEGQGEMPAPARLRAPGNQNRATPARQSRGAGGGGLSPAQQAQFESARIMQNLQRGQQQAQEAMTSMFRGAEK